jgi:hypothetical protein
MHEPPDDCAPGEPPEAQDDGGPYLAPRALLVSRHGRLSVFFEQGRRNQPDSQPNTEWHDDHVIQVAENGNNIGNQIDRTEGIDGHASGHGFGVPGDTRVTGRQIEGQHIPSEGMSPLAHALEYRHRPPSTSGTLHPRAIGRTQVYAPTSVNFAD